MGTEINISGNTLTKGGKILVGAETEGNTKLNIEGNIIRGEAEIGSRGNFRNADIEVKENNIKGGAKILSEARIESSTVSVTHNEINGGSIGNGSYIEGSEVIIKGNNPQNKEILEKSTIIDTTVETIGGKTTYHNRENTTNVKPENRKRRLLGRIIDKLIGRGTQQQEAQNSSGTKKHNNFEEKVSGGGAYKSNYRPDSAKDINTDTVRDSEIEL